MSRVNGEFLMSKRFAVIASGLPEREYDASGMRTVVNNQYEEESK